MANKQTVSNFDDYQFPDFGPWAKHPDRYLWVEITPYELQYQAAVTRGNNTVRKSSVPSGRKFKFLAPPSIQFSIDHSWEPYENISTRLANTISNWAAPLTADLPGVINNFKDWIGNVYNALSSTGKGSFRDNIGSTSEHLKNLASVEAVYYRPDAALVYKSSSNIQYILEFDLVAHGYTTGSTPHRIHKAIKELLIQSSPKKKDKSFVEIRPPSIFTVRTWPATDIINIEYAALVSVQPTHEYPYVTGYPLSNKIVLTFTDITPVFDESWSKGTSVTTSQSGLFKGSEAGGSYRYSGIIGS
jgi:hypothetical protein